MNYLSELLTAHDILINDSQAEQFANFKQLLIGANKRVNLTRIAPEDFELLHFTDSLLVSKIWDFSLTSKAIDIGTGAGFPGIPLAIVYPDVQFVLVDSSKKKIDFIEYAMLKLSLSNCVAIHSRAEDLASDPEHKQCYDLALARALADTATLRQLLSPFLTKEGRILALKGPNIEDHAESDPGIKKHEIKLHNTDIVRTILEMS